MKSHVTNAALFFVDDLFRAVDTGSKFYRQIEYLVFSKKRQQVGVYFTDAESAMEAVCGLKPCVCTSRPYFIRPSHWRVDRENRITEVGCSLDVAIHQTALSALSTLRRRQTSVLLQFLVFALEKLRRRYQALYPTRRLLVETLSVDDVHKSLKEWRQHILLTYPLREDFSSYLLFTDSAAAAAASQNLDFPHFFATEAPEQQELREEENLVLFEKVRSRIEPRVSYRVSRYARRC